MTCTPLFRDGKHVGWLCGRRQNRAPPCVVCGARSTRLCDGPGRKAGKTCDAPLCDRCATSGGPDVDYCPAHNPQAGADPRPLQPDLFRAE